MPEYRAKLRKIAELRQELEQKAQYIEDNLAKSPIYCAKAALDGEKIAEELYDRVFEMVVAGAIPAQEPGGAAVEFSARIEKCLKTQEKNILRIITSKE